MNVPEITLIIPSYLRPARTARAIECVENQTISDWELLVVGDCCPVLEQAAAPFANDPRVRIVNLPEHEGKYGTQCLNYGIEHATGKYICFMGNDDIILPEHFDYRLLSMADNIDFAYHDAIVRLPSGDIIRGGGRLAHGVVGGSELVIRTSFLQSGKIRFRSGEYGHDWTFIQDLLAAGAKSWYYPSATYVVMHVPGQGGTDTID